MIRLSKKVWLLGLIFFDISLALTPITFGALGQNCPSTFTLFLPLVINANEAFEGLPNSAPIPKAPPSPTDLCVLPLTFPVQSAEIAAYFNQVARPKDIAAFPEPFVHLLPEVTVGQKMVFFRSWAEAEQALPGLSDQIDLVGYNPEHWAYTPPDEQQNLPATVQQAAEFAHARGLRLLLVPDHQFVEDHLDELMPHVDILILQGQRLQDDPQAFATWVEEMVNLARASNPEARIYVQVGATQGPASEMFTAIQTVAADTDGIAIWSMPGSFDILQKFVSLIRPNALNDARRKAR